MRSAFLARPAAVLLFLFFRLRFLLGVTTAVPPCLGTVRAAPGKFSRSGTAHSATLGAVCAVAGKFSRFGTVHRATLGTVYVSLRLWSVFIARLLCWVGDIDTS